MVQEAPAVIERPGWVEFTPVWGDHPPVSMMATPDEEIAKAFGLAMANLRGELSDIETEKRFIRLRREIETKIK
ncbi:hypothetical protein [Bradyrhizobium vignae]|uniref:hypothetical protein n=1 Tax=Bradyrhizobium vignae TaxID=1549949 RepID=UPI00100AEA92|nr:hypothetical protein [Bradyrhizobium vignae]RXG93246.1 hypothetical protein EAV90_26740 [Bradyrhizobium vignae]